MYNNYQKYTALIQMEDSMFEQTLLQSNKLMVPFKLHDKKL